MKGYVSLEYSLIVLISIILAGIFLNSYIASAYKILANQNLLREDNEIKKFLKNLELLQNLGSNSSFQVQFDVPLYISCGTNFLLIKTSTICLKNAYTSSYLNFSECVINVKVINSTHIYANNTLYKIPAVILCDNIGFYIEKIVGDKVSYIVVGKYRNYYEGCDNRKIIIIPGNYICNTCFSDKYLIKKDKTTVKIYCS